MSGGTETLGGWSHAYCSNCGEIQPVSVNDVGADDVSGRFVGADVICSMCNYVVATVYRLAPKGRQ